MRNLRISTDEYHLRADIQSDILFRTVFDESPDAVFLLSQDFTITDCNLQAIRIFQAGIKDDLVGLNTFNLYDSEPVEFSRDTLVEAVNNGLKQVQEVAFKTIKGNVFWGRGTFLKVKATYGSLIVFRVRSVVDYMMTTEILSALIKSTSKLSGNAFFGRITELLVKTFGIGISIVAAVDHNKRKARTMHCWPCGKDNCLDEFSLSTGPSENVVKGYTTYYPSHLSEYFPHDEMVRKLAVESYVGAPFYNAMGDVSGLLILLDRKPMNEIPNLRFALSMFAARAGAELELMELSGQ